MDSEAFVRGMRCLCGAVTIIATRHDTEMAGLTATAVCSLTATPPRLIVCINVQGKTFKIIAKKRYFSVNILHHAQEELAKVFGGGCDPTIIDKNFNSNYWGRLKTGMPVLKEALVSFECSVDEMVMFDTHAILIGNVENIQENDFYEKPLLYYKQKYITPDPILDPVNNSA